LSKLRSIVQKQEQSEGDLQGKCDQHRDDSVE